MSFHVPEQFRITTGHMASDASYENNGAFRVILRNPDSSVFAIASDGIALTPEGWPTGWEHVSVSSVLRPTKPPSWEIMDAVKALFWDPEDTVLQFHPAASSKVNDHPGVLHLWRKVGTQHELPPSYLV